LRVQSIFDTLKTMRNVSRRMVLFRRIITPVFRPEFIFAAPALSAGIAIVFVNGPFQSPDEAKHFFRAYQISEGRFFSERINDKAGGRLPAALPDAVAPFQKISFNSATKIQRESMASTLQGLLNERERIFIVFPNTALNFPLCYLPQATGIYTARLSGLSPLKMMHALFCLWRCC